MDNLAPLPKNRYPGIKPFDTSEYELFFGRDIEKGEFYRLLMIQQLTVLYGKSGYGKSSLINAGIIPQLVQEDFTYFKVRFNNYINDKFASVPSQPIDNVPPVQTVKNVLSRMPDGQPVPTDRLDALIPNENSLWYYIKSHQYASGRSLFIILIDQFEELFSYPASQVQAFKDELADLLYSAMPLPFRQHEEKVLDNIDNEQADERTKRIKTFYERPEVKVVISIRSDQLSLLNNLKDKHPGILRYCYELGALQKESARLAITEPARMEGAYRVDPFEYKPDALEAILDAICKEQPNGKFKTETASLQIVCRYVEDNLLGPGEDSIIERHELGDIDAIFLKYYENVLRDLLPDERNKAQELLEDVLIQEGKRIPFEEGYLIKQYGVKQDLLNKLYASTLLRKDRDSQGRMMYEIGHDTMVLPIEEVAKERRKQQEEEKRLRLEEEQREQLRQEALDARQREKAAKEQAKEFKRLQNRAERWTNIAIGFAVAAFLAMLGVIKYYNKQESLIREAETERDRSDSMKQVAQTFLQVAHKEKAKSLLLRGDGFYSGIKDYKMASEYYHYANDSLDFNDPVLKRELKEKMEKSDSAKASLKK